MKVRVWVAIIAVVAFALGGYWMVRTFASATVVDRGAGVLSQPSLDCSGNGPSTRHCSDEVHLRISAGGTTVTLTDVPGLYATLKAQSTQQLDVDHVYYDTTNSEVNRLVYGTTSYRVEETKHAFLAAGIVALVVGFSSVVLLGYLIASGRRSRRGIPAAAPGLAPRRPAPE